MMPRYAEDAPDEAALQDEVERLRRAVGELSVLNETAEALGQASDLNALVQSLVRRALAAVEAEEGVIVLLGPTLTKGDRSPPTFVRSVATVAHRAATHPTVSHLGWVQAKGQPLVVNDPAGDARFSGAEWPDHVRSVLSVPMFAGGRMTGVFTLFNKRGDDGFSDDDARLLSILASQSAQAVERMRLADERAQALHLFGQHTAPQVVDALLSQADTPPVRRQEVTVLFLDLRGFTLRSEAWPPEAVVDYLNAVFGVAIPRVVACGGVVHQLLGDGLMALFGFPAPAEDAPAHAVASALSIVSEIEMACAEGRLPDTRIGIGIHTGECVVGPVGTEAHREYKVTGDVVNVTARIEKLCKAHGACILVSEALYDRLGDGAPPAERLGPIDLDGRHEPVAIVRLA